MDQTPALDLHNPDLLQLIPVTARTVIEVGCSSGALAREYKKINATCRYIGVEIMAQYIPLARRYCDSVLELDIERLGENDLRESLPGDCWIFGDTLEHLVDPWATLSRIRNIIAADGCVVACIPNAQHWSVQARLSCGAFRYEESGLFDRTHLRWFTRTTILEMFGQARFRIVAGIPRIFNDPMRDKFLPIIKQMASSAGADPDVAAQDALPLQYVVRAVPA